MKRMYHYATVSDALTELGEKGYTTDFNLKEEDIITNSLHYEIEHVYRYEGNSDPGDEAVVYGIKATSGEKGVFVAGFAASDSEAAQVLNEMSIRGRENAESN
ncbi:hypothetical protein [Flavobacterium sp. GT3R68]|uniref:hypothetical protein n=1 Tax=Flavobacterium sp. GT3R68 TaxID=2594437 RepID=UPI000F888F79|nr:hypothetical protein [Flavobacterium sp. GT3R68]RTY94919.1 hypothetical protein EKL32_08330 [Flavobacterium sp. GSN2]TRW91723.1 hypothetical protein FNW07_07505 [Flavobacterium sp. GT3R68]